MIALEEKITILPTLFVEKRDGRRVVFDVDKIDKALHKAADKVMDVTPLVEKTPQCSDRANCHRNS